MSKFKPLNQPFITMLPIWTHSKTYYNKFTTLPSEIILSDNQAPVSEKTLIQSLPTKLNNSTTNSSSDKTSLSQEQDKSILVNSTN